MQEELVVGILSDTHIPHRMSRLPDAVLRALAGVDVILHAGDVDDPDALKPLCALARVHAVRGNFHLLDWSDGGAGLPATAELELAGRQIVLTHGYRPGPVRFALKAVHVLLMAIGLRDNAILNQRAARRLAREYPDADIIIFGHSHQAHVAWVDGRLVINPGAVCSSATEVPSVALLYLGRGEPRVKIIPLEGRS